jgi:adenylate cyclase
MDQLDSPAGSRDPTLPHPPRATAGQSLSTRVSKARHDLRNPLIYILGFGEILQEEALAAGHRQLVPDFHAVHEAAAHIFAEVNHCLNLDNIKSDPGNIRKLQQTIQVYSERIITLTERLSGKCDTLENNSFGDDLLRITGPARQLQTLAPALLDSLADVEPGQVTAMESAAASYLIQQTGVEALLLHGSAGKQPLLGTLLVVDDNEADRAMLSRQLRRQGHTVSLAENGRQALEKLHTREFDVVLLDVMMSGMDGFEVLRRLKAVAVTQNVPVIMLSAMDETDAIVRCLELGAADYLAKPFSPAILQARVEACLANKRMSDQLRKYTGWLFGKTLFSQAVAAPGSLDLSRQERTILFADIRGFTHWSERHAPEEAVALLNRYFEAAERIWTNSSVIKTEYTGDEIMGVFPAAQDAVRIAQALRLDLGRLLGEVELGIGVGLHIGPVIEGLMGGAEVKDYRFVGDTVNTAKRICCEAQPGQVLLSEPTFVQVAPAVVTGPAFELSAKGKAEHLKVRPLLELVSTPA